MAPTTSSIDALYEINDAMEHLYEVSFMGRTILTTVTHSPKAVTEWIDDVKRDDTRTKRYVGFEAELFGGNLGTVQFCVGSRCLVIHLLRNPTHCYPTSLHHFLAFQNNVFVGVDIRTKMRKLAQNFPVIETRVQCVDLGEASARRYDREELRYAEHCELSLSALGVDVKMPEVDWGIPFKLSYAQVQYACVHAFLNLQIGRWLNR